MNLDRPKVTYGKKGTSVMRVKKAFAATWPIVACLLISMSVAEGVDNPVPVEVELTVEYAFDWSGVFINDVQDSEEEFIIVTATITPSWIPVSNLDWSQSDEGIERVPGSYNTVRLSRKAWTEVSTVRALLSYEGGEATAEVDLAVFDLSFALSGEEGAAEQLTLHHDDTRKLEISVRPESLIPESYQIQIKRIGDGDEDWLSLSENQTEDPWRFRVAGLFDMRGRVVIAGSQFFSTDYLRDDDNGVQVGVNFPTYAQIISDSGNNSRFQVAWQQTLAAAEEGREYGFWVTLNTGSNSYGQRGNARRNEDGTWTLPIASIQGPASIVNGVYQPHINPSVPIVGTPMWNDHPVFGSETKKPRANEMSVRYYVAFFHTHPSREFFPSNLNLPAGPSPADNIAHNTRKIPGIVYDFISLENDGSITGGTSASSLATRLYQVGNNGIEGQQAVDRRPNPDASQ